MKDIKYIYNIYQANFFIEQGLQPLGVGVNKSSNHFWVAFNYNDCQPLYEKWYLNRVNYFNDKIDQYKTCIKLYIFRAIFHIGKWHEYQHNLTLTDTNFDCLSTINFILCTSSVISSIYKQNTEQVHICFYCKYYVIAIAQTPKWGFYYIIIYFLNTPPKSISN